MQKERETFGGNTYKTSVPPAIRFIILLVLKFPHITLCFSISFLFAFPISPFEPPFILVCYCAATERAG